MARFSGEVVPTPGDTDHPFKVVFMHDGAVIGGWPCRSIAEGEGQIIAALRDISERARQEGYLK